MTDILVRNIDDDTLRKLKARARRDGRSLQAEVRHLLNEAADAGKLSPKQVSKALREIRRAIGPVSCDSAALIREDRNR